MSESDARNNLEMVSRVVLWLYAFVILLGFLIYGVILLAVSLGFGERTLEYGFYILVVSINNWIVIVLPLILALFARVFVKNVYAGKNS